MLNLILNDKKSLENLEEMPYSQMAFDGTHLYCCTGKSCKIYKLNCDGKRECCINTKRPYSSICFDCEEKCFWAIDPKCRNLIFKLDDCLCEIGSIKFPCQDRLYKDIFYSIQNDMLLLCGRNAVVKVSKSGALIPYYNGEVSIQFDSVIQVLDNLFINCNFQNNCPNIIAVLYPNFYFDYVTCMPRGLSLESFCVGYGCDNSVILFVLATQNYKYSYLIKYRVENCEDEKKCCSTSICKCEDNSGTVDVSVDCTDVRADILI